MGEMMGPLFVVITLALLSSWLLAMTMIPFLGVRFIKVPTKEENESESGLFALLNGYYKSVLNLAMSAPWATIGVILVMFVGSLSLFGRIPFIFFPDSDRNLVTLDLNLPLGTKIEKTAEVVEKIEAFITSELLTTAIQTQGITDWSSFI